MSHGPCHSPQVGSSATVTSSAATTGPVTDLPICMGKKLFQMGLMTMTVQSNLLIGIQLAGRDGLWEVACAPHCWLSGAAEEHHLQPRRINLHSGYDLCKASTWDHLRELRRLRKPRRVWFSLPCTKRCQWTSLNYRTLERQEVLETARRKERRLLWHVNRFIKESIDDGDDAGYYFEWPWPCFGWRQQPMEDLAKFMDRRGLPWLPCRIDGCRYGMKNKSGDAFVHKKWMIRTSDERFHKNFRAKVCPGNHTHCAIQGEETSRSSCYPWWLVQAIARFWREQHVPPRHLRLLSLQHDLPALCDQDGDEIRALLQAEAPTEEALPAEMSDRRGTEDDPYKDAPVDELRQWEAKIAKFHRAAGHPSNKNLARIIKDGGHAEWKVRMALDYKCPGCESLKQGAPVLDKFHLPARLPCTLRGRL